MNIGDKFKVICKRKKDEKTLIILHDYNDNRRFLWYIEANVRIGEVALLYKTEYLGEASKSEIKEYTAKANGEDEPEQTLDKLCDLHNVSGSFDYTDKPKPTRKKSSTLPPPKPRK